MQDGSITMLNPRHVVDEEAILQRLLQEALEHADKLRMSLLAAKISSAIDQLHEDRTAGLGVSGTSNRQDVG